MHLNYRTKDIYPEENKNYKYIGCQASSYYTYSICESGISLSKQKYYDSFIASKRNEKGECDYLYYYDTSATNYKKQNIYDRWVITIVFGCFIFVLDIALAIFGFLIFKDGGSSGTPL